MDGFSQLLDKEVDEFGTGALEVFSEGLGRDLGVGDLAELGGDFIDRGFGKIAAQLQDGGVAVFGGLSLIGFESRPDAGDDSLAPDAIEVFVGLAGVHQVAGGQGLELARSEVVDDQAVEYGAEIVAKASLALVGTGELARRAAWSRTPGGPRRRGVYLEP